MSKYIKLSDARFAVDAALEGRKWLLYKWQGDYGDDYKDLEVHGINIRDHRIESIHCDIARLRKFKEKLK